MQSCLLDIMYDWSLALNNDKNISSTFIDYKKAFDSISHIELINKLSLYEFSPLALNWIKAFLSNHIQQIKTGPEHNLSSILTCTSRVPQ